MQYITGLEETVDRTLFSFYYFAWRQETKPVTIDLIVEKDSNQTVNERSDAK